MTLMRSLLAAFAILFLLPVLASSAWWALTERPSQWNRAIWTSAGILPPPDVNDAAVYILAARTGGMKGAISLHSWIVLKRPGEARYERYDKVGWGQPVRRNHRDADGYWYSNRPFVVHAVEGEAAQALLPQFDAAIAAYPYGRAGGYHIWPGPNSNTFVAHVLDAVPEFGGRLPPHAVGRDYAPGWGRFGSTPDGQDFRASLGGYAGITFGWASGLEVNILGLVAGLDFARLGVKLPGVGLVALR